MTREKEARSNLTTGDELQSLHGLDEMLDELMESQDRLQRLNENLDLKVAELAEANIGCGNPRDSRPNSLRTSVMNFERP